MLYELDCPFVRQIVEKASTVCVEHSVHSLPLDSHCQRVQRLVRVATGPETIRVAFEVHLIDLIEDGEFAGKEFSTPKEAADYGRRMQEQNNRDRRGVTPQG